MDLQEIYGQKLVDQFHSGVELLQMWKQCVVRKLVPQMVTGDRLGHQNKITAQEPLIKRYTPSIDRIQAAIVSAIPLKNHNHINH